MGYRPVKVFARVAEISSTGTGQYKSEYLDSFTKAIVKNDQARPSEPDSLPFFKRKIGWTIN